MRFVDEGIFDLCETSVCVLILSVDVVDSIMSFGLFIYDI
jgi:hypothetical protein